MKLRFSAPVLLIALYGLAGTSASLPSQLRRNVQEVADVDDVADEAGQMITPDSVELAMGDECMMMCETTECHQHCASKCSHEAKKIASNKKKYCEDYGPDAPPLAPHHVCSEMNQCDECQGDCNSDDDCFGDLKCFQRDGANPTAGVPGCSGEGQPKVDYCYDPGRIGGVKGYGVDVCGPMLGVDVPKNCAEFSTCISDYALKQSSYNAIANKAQEECINGLLPGYDATLPSPSSGYANSECDAILVEPIDDKALKTMCGNFYTCVLKREAETDCAALVDDNNALDPIIGQYVKGKCDDSLGGWEQTCDKYYDCHSDPRQAVCNYCSMGTAGQSGMYQCEPMEECNSSCHDDWLFKVACEDMCSMMTEAAEVAAEEAQQEAEKTAAPTKSPTAGSTSSPTQSPTSAPTGSPTSSLTSSPMASPTSAPTVSPTADPTLSPTASPTKAPTDISTASPTSSPTASPTLAPTGRPTASPTSSPTNGPTSAPTGIPTASRTSSPPKLPTLVPTGSPAAIAAVEATAVNDNNEGKEDTVMMLEEEDTDLFSLIYNRGDGNDNAATVGVTNDSLPFQSLGVRQRRGRRRARALRRSDDNQKP